MKKTGGLFMLFFILLTSAVTLKIFLPGLDFSASTSEDLLGGKEYVIKNYGADIDTAARIFNLSPSYLKALCLLECEGKKRIEPRFEKHVYKKLVKVRDGELESFEHVTPGMLREASDLALRNLASSWGPFQLMGYKCLLLDIKIRDIRGRESVYWGVKWIDLTYGDLLRKKRFRDAFHMHNAGTRYPADGKVRTHNRSYIPRGLKYMKQFEAM